jgi:hypothetical protein
MSETLWDQKKPGEAGNGVADVSDQLGDNALLIYDRPDWVRHPTTGAQLRVIDQRRVKTNCPMCKAEVTGTLTEAKGGLKCLDCPSCKQFVWFSRK